MVEDLTSVVGLVRLLVGLAVVMIYSPEVGLRESLAVVGVQC